MLNLFLPVSVSQSFSSVCLESCQGFNVYNFPLLNFLGTFPNVDLVSLILISGNEKAGLVLVVCLPEEIAFGYMKIMFYFYAKYIYRFPLKPLFPTFPLCLPPILYIKILVNNALLLLLYFTFSIDNAWKGQLGKH